MIIGVGGIKLFNDKLVGKNLSEKLFYTIFTEFLRSKVMIADKLWAHLLITNFSRTAAVIRTFLEKVFTTEL